ncbi:LysR family transcriptional regulator [Ovoidimarina sediminis]|uniref:LysR family transcriptional regulator n=1 Tax=Ovoidimarina sediminis TaxID=3079856 RepID=UPI002909AD8A|nr:LysR family transcriptional regulator [Rhodophyticola sp. MJ-SS7]MDU8942394.1 LysR family transcriptional regulator [Rhodophyticola sp. MJ-SS7]
MNDIQLHRLDLNLLVTFEALMDEGSVAGAANRLGKTPSAISHALGRLREQAGDPLLVKVGGRMQPSPFALRLIEDVRPILRAVQRAFAPPEPFDPATSRRVFRIAMPAMTSLIAEIFERLNREAPHVALEWASLDAGILTAVADEQIDLALMGADKTLPEGLMERRMAPLERLTFLRQGHPALANWNRQAWLDWPHVMVGMASAGRQTVEDHLRRDGLDRQVGARLSEFSGVAPLIARTNMLWTTVLPFMVRDIATYDLAVRHPPVDLPDFEFRFLWSSRLSADPGNRWLRDLVIGAYETLEREAKAARFSNGE